MKRCLSIFTSLLLCPIVHLIHIGTVCLISSSPRWRPPAASVFGCPFVHFFRLIVSLFSDCVRSLWRVRVVWVLVNSNCIFRHPLPWAACRRHCSRRPHHALLIFLTFPVCAKNGIITTQRKATLFLRFPSPTYGVASVVCSSFWQRIWYPIIQTFYYVLSGNIKIDLQLIVTQHPPELSGRLVFFISPRFSHVSKTNFLPCQSHCNKIYPMKLVCVSLHLYTFFNRGLKKYWFKWFALEKRDSSFIRFLSAMRDLPKRNFIIYGLSMSRDLNRLRSTNGDLFKKVRGTQLAGAYLNGRELKIDYRAREGGRDCWVNSTPKTER